MAFFEAEFLVTQKIRMRARAEQLVQDAYPLWLKRPLQTDKAQRKRACFGPLWSVLALHLPVVLLWAPCSCCCLEYGSLFLVSVFVCVFISGRSLCVSTGISTESCGCVFFHDESWKDGAERGGGWIGNYGVHVWKATKGLCVLLEIHACVLMYPWGMETGATGRRRQTPTVPHGVYMYIALYRGFSKYVLFERLYWNYVEGEWFYTFSQHFSIWLFCHKIYENTIAVISFCPRR